MEIFILYVTYLCYIYLSQIFNDEQFKQTGHVSKYTLVILNKVSDAVCQLHFSYERIVLVGVCVFVKESVTGGDRF